MPEPEAFFLITHTHKANDGGGGGSVCASDWRLNDFPKFPRTPSLSPIPKRKEMFGKRGEEARLNWLERLKEEGDFKRRNKFVARGGFNSGGERGGILFVGNRAKRE